MKTNPLTLLTMGGTLDRVKDRTGAYKLPNGNVLPKFGAAGRQGNPTAPAVQSSLFENTAGPVAPAPRSARVFRISDFGLRMGGTSVAWARKFASELYGKICGAVRHMPSAFSNPKSEIRLAAPKRSDGGKPQFELALEKVTVVRNNLSDADLMVVPGARKKEIAPAITAVGSGATGNAWTRVTARWIKLNPETAPKIPAPAAIETHAARKSEWAQTQPGSPC